MLESKQQSSIQHNNKSNSMGDMMESDHDAQ